MSQTPDPRPGHYYVSCIDGDRKLLLLGPLATHQEALDKVEPVRAFALTLDSKAAFYAFGTARKDLTEFGSAGKLNRSFAESQAKTAEPAPSQGPVFVQLREKGTKAWKYIQSDGRLVSQRVHAGPCASKAKAQEFIDANKDDNPEYEWRIAPPQRAK